MIISKRPVTSEKTLLAITSPSIPLAASVARLASTAAALTSHRVKRTFGEWLAKATESTPAPQPTSKTLPLVCGVSVESSSWLPTSRPSRLNTPGRVLMVRFSVWYSSQYFSASKTGCFSRRPWYRPQRRALSTLFSGAYSASICSALRTPLRFSPTTKISVPTGNSDRMFINWNWASGLFFGQ